MEINSTIILESSNRKNCKLWKLILMRNRWTPLLCFRNKFQDNLKNLKDSLPLKLVNYVGKYTLATRL